jgi:hypothetical protein
MEIHTVQGAAGVKLHVREYGKSSGAIGPPAAHLARVPGAKQILIEVS